MPTASDDVFFDANSGAVTVTVTATAQCLTLNCTGYTGTLTGSSNIIVAGSVTFDAGMTLTCTGLMTITAAATLNWAGLTWGGAMTWTNNNTKTLTSDIAISGNFISGGSSTTAGVFNFYIGGSFTPSFGITGTITIILNGTGTWSTAGGACLVNLTINTAGTITISGNVYFGTNKFLYTAGTMVVTGSSVLTQGSYTIDASGMTFNNFGTFTTGTGIIQSDINMTGQLALGAALVTSGAFTINCGGITATGAISGNANIIINSSGTWSGGGRVQLNLTINTAGIFTISGSVLYSTGTITYTAGTVITTGSTLTIATTVAILNTAGIIWNNITISINGTTVNNSLLTISGTLTYSATSAITFGGTAGWTCGTFTCTVAGLSHTLTVGNTYTITSAFTINAATNASRITLKSGTPGTKVIFTLNPAATQNVGYVNATDLDSNAGQTIYSFNGVITTTFNWQTLTYPRQSSFIFQH